MSSFDSIDLGTAATIQVVAALPTTGVQNFQQHTLFKLPSGEIHRLTKPIFKATPASADFELLVPAPATVSYSANTTAGTAFDPAKDYQVFNGDVAIDIDDITAVGKVHVFECDTNDLVITFSNGTVQNKGSSPMFDTAGAFVNMRAGMVYTVTKIAANLVVVE